MVGKQHREAIPKRSLWRASQRLQLIHADICGPITPVSNSKKRYFISFIDDFSRKVWIYFLAEKSKAFTIFKNYKNMVEKEAGTFIWYLRTDRGGEFTSLEFNKFCNHHGISRQLTTTYTPQQNGVAERKNRTIINMVKSMLSEKQVLKKFCPKAVNWTTHVLNRSPTLVVKEMTPVEAWSDVKPNVNYFQVFGCIGHVHVPYNLRKKLNDKSFQCVLLGMSEESKAYRLYNPISENIVTSRDVVFDEDECWNWQGNIEVLVSDTLEWGDNYEEESEHDQNEVKEETKAYQNEEDE